MSEPKKKKKKRRRKYKLVWPSNNPAYQKKMAEKNAQQPKKKKKRKHYRLTWKAYAAIGIAVFIAFLIWLPQQINTSRLRNIGYDDETIKIIKEEKLTSTIIDNEYYSEYLAASLKDGTLNEDYIEYYNVVSADRGLTSKDFLIINRLKEKGYLDVQLLNLVKNLYDYELTPLLVYDYQSYEDNYIDDCKNHRDVNSETHFEVSGSYYEPYLDVYPVTDLTVSMLVNKTYYLSASYLPDSLSEMSVQYASSGQYLETTAYEAFQQWCDAGREAGHTIYAASAYRSYDSQESVYSTYIQGMGQSLADQASARPGYSEHQTGYAVDISVSNEDTSLEFKDTEAYQWAKDACAEYGWILRYPEGKEDITQYEFESWHYRYVGKDLAKKVVSSNLTYDEYWCLYLKPWQDASNVPSQEILIATGANSAVADTTSQNAVETTESVEALPAETVETSEQTEETQEG